MTHFVASPTLDSANSFVVVAIGGAPSVLKLSFMVIGWANEFHQNKASSDFQRWTLKRASDLLDSLGIGLLPSGRVDLTGDEDLTDKYGDIGMGDSIGVLVSLGGGIFQESNIGDSDNTGYEGTIVSGRIDKQTPWEAQHKRSYNSKPVRKMHTQKRDDRASLVENHITDTRGEHGPRTRPNLVGPKCQTEDRTEMVQSGLGRSSDFQRWTLKRASDLLDSLGIGLLPSGRVDLTGDEDLTDKYGDIGMGDSIGVLVSLGGGIFQESNIGDSDNTGYEGTIVSGRIGDSLA
nr:hypothetical protein [Tanacetum cinerariifolium]